MTETLIPIRIKKVLQQSTYTSIVLGNENKSFAIYMAHDVGKNIQNYLADAPPIRPYTYDLLSNICIHFEMKWIQVVLLHAEEGIYFARLFVEQKKENITQILEIDARPSDCLILAVKEELPILCSETLLNESIAFEE